MPIRQTFVTFVPFPMTKSFVKQCTDHYCTVCEHQAYTSVRMPEHNAAHRRYDLILATRVRKSKVCNWQTRLFRAIRCNPNSKKLFIQLILYYSLYLNQSRLYRKFCVLLLYYSINIFQEEVEASFFVRSRSCKRSRSCDAFQTDPEISLFHAYSYYTRTSISAY